MDLTPFLPAPLWRRLASAFYDALLAIALLFITSALDLAVRNALALPPSPGATRVLLFFIGFAFFGWFWTHGGQTLGMRAWRLQLRRVDGRALGWPTAAARYALAWLAWLPLGAGVLWSAIDARRRAWHDIGSGTEVVLLPKESRPWGAPTKNRGSVP